MWSLVQTLTIEVKWRMKVELKWLRMTWMSTRMMMMWFSGYPRCPHGDKIEYWEAFIDCNFIPTDWLTACLVWLLFYLLTNTLDSALLFPVGRQWQWRPELAGRESGALSDCLVPSLVVSQDWVSILTPPPPSPPPSSSLQSWYSGLASLEK